MGNEGEIANALGRLLFAYRAANKLSRKDLGALIGLSDKRIQQLEEQKEEAGDVRFGLILNFARVQQKPLGEFMDELMEEAQLSDASSRASFEHVVRKHVRREVVDALTRYAKSDKKWFGNNLAWALEIAGLLLRLKDSDRLEMEMAIRRKSPDRNKPENLARLREIFNYTLEE